MNGLQQINTGEVKEIGKKLKGLMVNLSDTISKVEGKAEYLSNSWKGEAATATIEAITNFSKDYNTNYKDYINEFADVLINFVTEEHESTETTNTQLGDAFK